MDYISSILAALKGASPWVVLAGTVLTALWIILAHREKTREQTDANKNAVALRSLQSVITDHIAKETKDQVGLSTSLDQLTQQLMTLNASREGTYVSVENTRMIILYQWNWCRDETSRILLTSIDRNHIQGREAVVASQVARAWRKTAQEARTSLDQLKGLSADYTGLFSPQTLTAVWDATWRRAMPIYFKDFPIGSGTEDDHRSELNELVKSLFDNAYDEFIACSYEEHSTATGREKSNSAIPINADDMRLAENMVLGMQQYTPGSRLYKAIKPGSKTDGDQQAVRAQVGLSVRQARTSPPDMKM